MGEPRRSAGERALEETEPVPPQAGEGRSAWVREVPVEPVEPQPEERKALVKERPKAKPGVVVVVGTKEAQPEQDREQVRDSKPSCYPAREQTCLPARQENFPSHFAPT
ncbi:MAG: hypothetical protein Q8L46_00025 [candidate division WWE3 bacterium]|nr:hypothetical protein [candidate division WWE3 bacterium]